MFHFFAPLLICYLIHGCRYTQYIHRNSSTVGIFLAINFILFLIPIFVCNLNVLSSLCKVDIRSTAINIFSAAPVIRTGLKGERASLISCVSGMRSVRVNKIGTEYCSQRDVKKRGAKLSCTIMDPVM